MTNGFAKEKIREMIQINGIENIYKFILTGFRDADITFEPESLRSYGNVIGIVDCLLYTSVIKAAEHFGFSAKGVKE